MKDDMVYLEHIIDCNQQVWLVIENRLPDLKARIESIISNKR